MTDSNDKTLPNPGSIEAIEAGCTCPVVDNFYGLGMYVHIDGTVSYVYNLDCPIHRVQFRTACREE